MVALTPEKLNDKIVDLLGRYSHLTLEEQMTGLKKYIEGNILSHRSVLELREWLERLEQSQLIRDILKPGDAAPGFSLTNVDGKIIRLSNILRRRKPAIIVFYRGAWCPFCNIYLNALESINTKVQEQGAVMVAISPQTPDHCMTMAERNRLSFEILSDIGNMVARRFGLVTQVPPDIVDIYEKMFVYLSQYNGDDSNELPIPAVFVIGRDGKVFRAFISPDYTQRIDPEKIIDALIELKHEERSQPAIV